MGATASEAGWKREGALFVIAMIGVAAVVAVFAFTAGGTTPHGGSVVVASPTGLGSFQSDSQLQQYIEANAKSAQQYNRYGVSFGGGLPVVFGAAVPGIATLQASLAASSASSTPSFTGTNVQVQGVDEPDRVKTDGTISSSRRRTRSP